MQNRSKRKYFPFENDCKKKRVFHWNIHNYKEITLKAYNNNFSLYTFLFQKQAMLEIKENRCYITNNLPISFCTFQSCILEHVFIPRWWRRIKLSSCRANSNFYRCGKQRDISTNKSHFLQTKNKNK